MSSFEQVLHKQIEEEITKQFKNLQDGSELQLQYAISDTISNVFASEYTQLGNYFLERAKAFGGAEPVEDYESEVMFPNLPPLATSTENAIFMRSLQKFTGIIQTEAVALGVFLRDNPDKYKPVAIGAASKQQISYAYTRETLIRAHKQFVIGIEHFDKEDHNA